MRKISLIFSFLVLLSTVSTAQKYGHLNFGNLLSSMPATKAADIELEAYQKQLLVKGENMVKKLQAKYEGYSSKTSTVSPKQAKEWELELTKMQQEIGKYEQEVQQKLIAKRQTLLDPIIKKANKAVADVAKEQGYALIFDSSVFNSILFGAEAVNVMVFVAAKLGL